jgi:hypothetical protein
MIPCCPEKLPGNLSELLTLLGKLWAESDTCPHIKIETKRAWDNMLHAWSSDNSLPLLIRKGSLVKGSEIIHSSGRVLIPTDNSPAQWACHLALRDIVPTLEEIKDYIQKDSIPVAFAHKKKEQGQRKYHKTLGNNSINKFGWQLCHIQNVGLNFRTPLESSSIDDLKRAFISLLSPSNFFVVPKVWGGMGDTSEFITAFQIATPNQ